MEIIELRNAVIKMKILLDRLGSQLEMTEGRIHKLEERSVEFTKY
jgi:hypothetical protein